MARSGEPPARGGRLAGKVCLVTGAGAGIGRATAALMAAEGATVVLTDIDLAAAEDAAAAAQADGGGRCLALEHDVAEEAAWERCIGATLAEAQRLDVLVNNAGVAFGRPLADTSIEDWRWVMSVNLDGAFLGVKHALRAMRRRGGSIVNVGSALSLVGRPLTGAVAASKGGVLQLTRTAALEGALRRPPVRVNAVLPGGVETAIFGGQAWWPNHRGSTAARAAAARRDILSDTPLRRLGTAGEIARAILLLASDEASFITGAALAADGGLTAA